MQPLAVDSNVAEAVRLRANWMRMSACFGMMSSVAVVILSYTSSILRENGLGLTSSAVLYAAWLSSSIFLGGQATSMLGSKTTLMVGAALYCTNYACLVLAFVVESLGLITFLVVLGGLANGLGAGLLWTAQGVYFSQTAKAIAEAKGQRVEEVTGELAAPFAAWNLGSEVVLKIALGLVQQLLPDLEPLPWLMVFLIIGVSATVAMVGIETYATTSKVQSLGDRCKGFAKVWAMPELWLLSFMNFTFGMSAGLMNGEINAATSSDPNLGPQFVGFFGAGLSLIATFSQPMYLAITVASNKGIALALGSICFLTIPFGITAFTISTLGWGITMFYVAQGLGRGAYESTNRAVFADFFPGSLADPAFASVALQQALGFTASYTLQAILRNQLTDPEASPDLTSFVYIVTCLAIPIFPGYVIATSIRKNRALSGQTEETL